MFSLTYGAVSLISAGLGIVGNKAFDTMNSKRSLTQQLTVQTLTGQRADLLTTKQELEDTEKELDEFKTKYYEVLEENINLKAELEDWKENGRGSDEDGRPGRDCR